MIRNLKFALIILVGVAFALAIVLFLFSFTVRFTDVAVVTRFGQARQEFDGSKNPGLHFKLPYPVDSVTKYDTRMRLVQMRKEAQQTADNRQVIVEAFCTWRVADANRFFERFSSEGDRTDQHYEAATDTIRTRLRTAVGEISRYRIDELFAVDTGTGESSHLSELEGAILAALRTSGEGGQTFEQLTGIEVSGVGISSVVLPQETSKAVFDRMKQDRQTLVQEISSRADSEAQAILSAAETDRDKIEAFVNVKAQEMRAQGDIEAQGYLRQMAEHEGLAVFLEKVEFLRDFLSRKATLVLSTDNVFFTQFDPNVMAKTPEGEVPGIAGFPGLNTAPARDDTEATEEPEAPAAATDPKEFGVIGSGGGR